MENTIVDYNHMFVKQVIGFGTLFSYYDAEGTKIGQMKVNPKTKKSIGNYIGQLLGLYSILGQNYTLEDNDQNIIMKLEKEGGFKGLFQAKTVDGKVLVTYKSKFSMTPKVLTFDDNQNEIANLTGDLLGLGVKVVDTDGEFILSIAKKTIGDSVKDFFTKGDIYEIKFNEDLDKEQKLKFISLPVVYDLLFFNK